MKKIITLLMTLLLFIGTCCFVSAESGYSGKISIVHVNDVHGAAVETNEAIGYAKISGFIDNLKSENPNTLALDAGDVFTGSSYTAFDKAESIAAILNTINFDAMTAGNADFPLGIDRVNELRDKLQYPMLAGNMLASATGETALDGYTITTLEDSGIVVGIIGVTTPMSTTGFKAVDPIETAKELMAVVKPQVDLVIGLVHLGDTTGVTSMDLANQVEGFDVIIDGHSHTALPSGRTENGTLIAQAGGYGQYIGVVDLTVEAGKIVDKSARLVGKEDLEETQANAETAAAVETMITKFNEAMLEVVGYTNTPLEGPRPIIRTREASAGNLFTDALRTVTGADVCITWAGTIWSDTIVGNSIEPGPLTRKDVLDLVKADSNVITTEMTGSDIIAALNVMVKDYPTVSGSFPQVSGITFKFDPSKESDRVFGVTVQGSAIDLEKIYTVAMYEAFFDVLGLTQNGSRLGEYGYATTLLEKYIIENTPIAPQAEGRIIAAGSGAYNTFKDIDVASWYYESVSYGYDHGLFVGTSASTFSPDDKMTRAMFITVLGRLAESLDVEIGDGTMGALGAFSDVSSDTWYSKYLNWAIENDIIKGYGNGLFGTHDNVTREQSAAIIARFLDYMDISLAEGTPVTFTDASAVADWAKDAVDLVSASGIVLGYPDSSFKPQGSTTRTETAAIIMRFAKLVTADN